MQHCSPNHFMAPLHKDTNRQMAQRPPSDPSAENKFSRDVTSIILESISDGVFTVDAQWRITSFNRAAEEITGVSRTEAIGRQCADVFRASMCEADCALRHTLSTGTPIINRTPFIINPE